MPHAARLRKVGGSVMLAIPKPLLDALHLAPDASVDLSIKAGRLVVDPKTRRRHSLPTVGHEQQGKRPVLVISPGKFNRLTRMPVVLPITTGGDFARTAGFAVSLMGAGTRTTGVVRCDQPRALDLRARGAKRLETAPGHIIDEVLSKVGTLFE
jgi:mRNA interferase ChpB